MPVQGDVDAGARRVGVLDDVRQGFGDDEVRGRLQPGSQAWHGHAEVDGQREVGDQRLESGAEAATGERGGQDATHDIAELGVRSLGVASASSTISSAGSPAAMALPGELER